MMRILRHRVLIVSLVAIGIAWGAWAIWRSPHLTIIVGSFTPLAGLIKFAISAVKELLLLRHNSETGDERPRDDLADRLAKAVKQQWTSAAMERQLIQSEVIHIRWLRSTRPLVGPVSTATGSRRFPPMPGLAVAGEEWLRQGGISDLHAIYGGLGSGRLVIVGAPGSGKSGTAVLLILQALKHREHRSETDRANTPVPVMVTAHGWDPHSQSVQNWLVSRLQQTYPLFAGKNGAAQVANLLQAGKIAVILDGFDEIAHKLQPVAIQALNEQATFRLAILSRSTEMATTAQHMLLEGAVALELQDIAHTAAADYLTRIQVTPPPTGWDELTDHLRYQPNSPITQALSNPLTLTLVRDTYRSSDNVHELLKFCTDATHPISRKDIEDHLIDRVLPTAYTPHPGQSPPRYDLHTAQRTLSAIAAQMNRDTTRDLAWWRISTWALATPRIIVLGLGLGLVFMLKLVFKLVLKLKLVLVFGLLLMLVLKLKLKLGLGLGLGFKLWIGLVSGVVLKVVGELVDGLGLMLGLGLVLVRWLIIGFVFGLASGLVFKFMLHSPQRITPTRWHLIINRSSLKFALRVGLKFGAFVGPVLGLTFGLVFGLSVGLSVGLLFGLAGGLIGMFMGVLLVGLFQPKADNASPLTPLASWSRNRTVGLVSGLAFGFVPALVVGLVLLAGKAIGTGIDWQDVLRVLVLLAGGPTGSGIDWQDVLRVLVLLAGGLTGGLTGGLMSSATWETSLTFAQLARRWHTPIRLMRFLEDARQRNVLRTVGPVYQFRHARLQDRLAAQNEITTNTGTTGNQVCQ